MLITILTGGSRGDIQPYIALGLELKKAGQRVRLATFENYADFVTDHGLEFYPIEGDSSQAATSDKLKSATLADNPLKLILSFNKLKSLVFDVQKDFFNACQGSDSIVYHPGIAIGYFIAQHMHVPGILATPFPMTPTREYPALMFYNSPRLGPGFNYLTHKLFEQVMWSASSSAVKQFWKQEFGSAPVDFGNPFGRQISRRLPTLVACSEHVFPRPVDWPEHVTSPGYWFLEEEANWTPSGDLLEFLQQGSKPVYVGFGSLGDSARAVETTQLVIRALQRSGQRGILATGWSGMTSLDELPAGIFILESAPHAWLFPRMAAVVHHGGAGTTAAGLRAGVPAIIVPHSNDQFAWGRRVQELGVGPNPVPRKKLTAENLATAIQLALAEDVRKAAGDLGEKIRSESGVSTAAQVILDCLKD
jgi:sterol 3beta-glucosyltransferase